MYNLQTLVGIVFGTSLDTSREYTTQMYSLQTSLISLSGVLSDVIKNTSGEYSTFVWCFIW
jgi:hypothetical protein